MLQFARNAVRCSMFDCIYFLFCFFHPKRPIWRIIIIIVCALIMFIIEIEENKSTIGQQCHSELTNGEGEIWKENEKWKSDHLLGSYICHINQNSHNRLKCAMVNVLVAVIVGSFCDRFHNYKRIRKFFFLLNFTIEC